MCFLVVGAESCSPTKKFFEPDFSFPLTQKNRIGNLFDLTTLPHQVRYVILNVFAPNCPPCVTELAAIKKLYKTSLLKRKDIFFVALGSTLDTLSSNNPPKDDEILVAVNGFKKKYSLQYPVYLANSKILQSFGVTGFPETFIFTKDKEKRENSYTPLGVNLRLVRKFISSITFREVEDFLDR